PQGAQGRGLARLIGPVDQVDARWAGKVQGGIGEGAEGLQEQLADLHGCSSPTFRWASSVASASFSRASMAPASSHWGTSSAASRVKVCRSSAGNLSSTSASTG